MTLSDDEHEYRRKNDVIVAKIQTTLDDFVKRYERDMEAQNADISKVLLTIQAHDEFIRDIRPIYAKGMVALGAAALGTIGVLVHWVWGNVHWGR